jgi:hypothetical protein
MIAWQQAEPQWFQRLLCCDVESKWKNCHITTFPGQSLSKTGLSLEEAMDLSRDRQIEKKIHEASTMSILFSSYNIFNYYHM